VSETLVSTSAMHIGVDQVRSGWMMLSALVVREMSPSVSTTDGEYITVNIIRTSQYRVLMSLLLTPLPHNKQVSSYITLHYIAVFYSGL